jgi:hypothetical protein
MNVGGIEGVSGDVYAAATGIMAVGANAAIASASGPGITCKPGLRAPAKAGVLAQDSNGRQATRRLPDGVMMWFRPGP